MRQQHFILTGIPASGKSTIGKGISEALDLEMLDKDEILEELFNKKGVGDANWRTNLSRAADEILRERAFRSEKSVIVSWWRHPASSSASGTPIEWLYQLQGVVIEVRCICDPSIAIERFKSRLRHSGHLDHSKSYADLLTTFQQQASLGPLGIGQLVEVNTEAGVRLAEVIAEIKSLLT